MAVPQRAAIAPGQYLIVYLDGQSELTRDRSSCQFQNRPERALKPFLLRPHGPRFGPHPSGPDPHRPQLQPARSALAAHLLARSHARRGIGTGYYGYAQNPSCPCPAANIKARSKSPSACPTAPSSNTPRFLHPTEQNGIRYEGETLTFNKVTVLRAPRPSTPPACSSPARPRRPPT